MPTAPLIACPCGGRRASGEPCTRCGRGGKREARRRYDVQRGTAAQRGYDYRWRNENEDGAADLHLKAYQLCEECRWYGRITAATLVDHKRPHKGDMELFWQVHLWQSLCRECHKLKTMREGRAMPKYVVCGPPGSGKTTWVKQRAKPGDLVFDADYLVSAMFGTPLRAPVEHGMAIVERLRATVVDWLLNYPDRSAYVIQADQERARQTAYDLGAELVVLTERGE